MDVQSAAGQSIGQRESQRAACNYPAAPGCRIALS